MIFTRPSLKAAWVSHLVPVNLSSLPVEGAYLASRPKECTDRYSPDIMCIRKEVERRRRLCRTESSVSAQMRTHGRAHSWPVMQTHYSASHPHQQI